MVEGEGANCGDFLVGTPAVTLTPCALPGINVVTDPAGDNVDAPNAQRDLRSVSMAELFDPVSSANKLFITLKVGDLNPLPAAKLTLDSLLHPRIDRVVRRDGDR